MKFTTPCFVCVEDAEKRKELQEWLQNIGYNVYDWYWGKYIRVFRCWTSPKGISKAVGYPCKQVRKTDIDCGHNIEMFKALAAMNEENDRDQWFALEEEDMLFFCQLDSMQDYDCHYLLKYRKASVEEIIEHFKKMRR